MAKEPIKESIITTHKKDVVGTLNLDDLTVENEDFDEPKKIVDLFKHFNGEIVTISITNKTEGEVPEE